MTARETRRVRTGKAGIYEPTKERVFSGKGNAQDRRQTMEMLRTEDKPWKFADEDSEGEKDGREETSSLIKLNNQDLSLAQLGPSLFAVLSNLLELHSLIFCLQAVECYAEQNIGETKIESICCILIVLLFRSRIIPIKTGPRP